MDIKYAVILLEIILICFAGAKIIKVFRYYRHTDPGLIFTDRMEQALSGVLKNRLLLSIVLREICVFYYLFSKNRKSISEHSQYFTYHKDSGYLGILIALSALIALEGAGLFYLLHKWIPVLSWIHLILNLYGILYLISDYRAIIRNPIIVTKDNLIMNIGFRKKLIVAKDNIASINDGKLNYETDKKRKDIFLGVLLQMDFPHYEIVLNEQLQTKNFVGRMVPVKKIYVSVDDKQSFYNGLMK